MIQINFPNARVIYILLDPAKLHGMSFIRIHTNVITYEQKSYKELIKGTSIRN